MSGEVIGLELVKLAEKLDHMEEVLAWASENVWSAGRVNYPKPEWEVCSAKGDVMAPTLYQAIHTAWEKRDE